MTGPYLKLVFDRHVEAFALRDKQDKFVAWLDVGPKSIALDPHARSAILALQRQTPVTKEQTKVVSADTEAVLAYVRERGVTQCPARGAAAKPAVRPEKKVVRTDIGPLTLEDIGL
jgi:hypothetical protein